MSAVFILVQVDHYLEEVLLLAATSFLHARTRNAAAHYANGMAWTSHRNFDGFGVEIELHSIPRSRITPPLCAISPLARGEPGRVVSEGWDDARVGSAQP